MSSFFVKSISILLVTCLIWHGFSQPCAAAVDESFDGEGFDLRKQSEQDKYVNEPVSRSARIWIELQNIYEESSKSNSAEDAELVATIKNDQQAKYTVALGNVWNLFSERMKEKRYADAGSCLTLAGTLLEKQRADCPASKVLLNNARQLQDSERTGANTKAKLKKGFISLSDEPLPRIAEDTDVRANGTSPKILEYFRRLHGFTGLKIVDGRVDTTIKYSPSYVRKCFERGDEVVSIDGVVLHGLSNEVVWGLLKGRAGTVARIEIRRGKEEKTIDIMRQEYPSLSALPHMNAREKYELGVQLRDIGDVPAARIALEQAESMGKEEEVGVLAGKVLRSRIPKFQPTPEADHLNTLAYHLRFNHEDARAEGIFRQCIKRWPQYEWPYKNLAGLLIEQKRWSDAKDLLDQLLIQNPDYARGWQLMAEVKKGLGDTKGAAACRAHGLELDPDDSP